jgi:hypothetical protein
MDTELKRLKRRYWILYVWTVIDLVTIIAVPIGLMVKFHLRPIPHEGMATLLMLGGLGKTGVTIFCTRRMERRIELLDS